MNLPILYIPVVYNNSQICKKRSHQVFVLIYCMNFVGHLRSWVRSIPRVNGFFASRGGIGGRILRDMGNQLTPYALKSRNRIDYLPTIAARLSAMTKSHSNPAFRLFYLVNLDLFSKILPSQRTVWLSHLTWIQ